MSSAMARALKILCLCLFADLVSAQGTDKAQHFAAHLYLYEQTLLAPSNYCIDF